VTDRYHPSARTEFGDGTLSVGGSVGAGEWYLQPFTAATTERTIGESSLLKEKAPRKAGP
jgi:hypothetical protein